MSHQLINELFTIAGSREKPLLIDSKRSEKVAKATILFVHGFKGFKDWGHFNLIAEHFAKNDYLFVKFNFSYNGGTIEDPLDFPDETAFGENNLSTELNDLELVIDFLEKNKMIHNQLILMGHSRGGAISIIKSAEDERIDKLITLAALSDFEARLPDYKAMKNWKLSGVRYLLNSRTKQNLPMFYQYYEDLMKNKARLNVINAAKSLIIPYLIVHGTADESVSFDDAVVLNNASNHSKLVKIENANHTFGGSHPYLEESLPLETAALMDKIEQFLES